MSIVLPIEEDQRYRIYTASAGQTQFPIAFPFQQDEDIAVAVGGDPAVWQALSPTLYSIAGAGAPGGGMITFHAGRALGERILVLGEAVLDRTGSIVADGRFASRLTDDEFDRGRIIQQEIGREAKRALKMDFGAGDGLTVVTGLADGQTLMKHGDLLVAGPDILAEAARAEAARDAAAGYVNDIASEKEVPITATFAGVAYLIFPEGMSSLQTRGRNVIGDGDAFQIQRYTIAPLHPEKIQDASGAWWGRVREKRQIIAGSPMRVYAHRGAAGLGTVPETTLLAYSSASRSGFRNWEVDVCLTQDRYIVCFHDDSNVSVLMQKANGDAVTGPIGDHALAEAQSWRFKKAVGTGIETIQIPTVDAFLDLVVSFRVERVHMELKGPIQYDNAAVLDLVTKIKARGLQHRVVLQSGDIGTSWYIRSLDWNIGISHYIYSLTTFYSLADQFVEIGNFHPAFNQPLITGEPSVVTFCHDRGMEVTAFTITTATQASVLASLGVDGIYADYLVQD